MLQKKELGRWTEADVGVWLGELDFDESTVGLFKANHVTGAVLMDIEEEDLRTTFAI